MERNENPESPWAEGDDTAIPAPRAPSRTGSGLFYPSGAEIPPTHPDHGPMHLLPRQEDGGFAAYYYCSREELDDADISEPPPRRHRRDGFSADRQREFVEHYRNTASLTDAAHLTGIARSTVYNLLNSPDAGAFRAAIEEAGRGLDTILEATAFERAVNGQEEIVYYQGQRVGVRWKYDNRLLMSLLRARNPLKYAPLSEIEGWLARRGVAPPADVEGALDRLAAAEAEWGRHLPDEPPDSRLEAPALASNSSTSATEPPVQASNSSTSEAEPPTEASNSSTLDAEPPMEASNSSTLPAEAPAAPEPPHAAYRPPPRPRIHLAG